MKLLGLMIDCSRNSVLTVDAAKRLIDLMSRLGYTHLELYTEDTYTIDTEPRFGALRGRYSKEEIREIDSYAISKNIVLRPCIQTLAHLESIFAWEEYKQLNDCANILLCEDEKTYTLIEKMFKSLSECFSCREVNIGMDEAALLGRGKYYRTHGDVPQVEIMRRHLKRVAEIADSYGFSCRMWGDMFFDMAFDPSIGEPSLEKAREATPKNVSLICWDYYNTRREHYLWKTGLYMELTDKLSFAAGAWNWVGYAPGTTYAMKATEEAFLACEERGIDDFMITLWGDDGGECSPFASLPVIFTVSEYAKGIYDKGEIAKHFYELTGLDLELFIDLELPNRYHAEELRHPVNPGNHLLFNDPFLGLCDKAPNAGDAPEYFANAEKRLANGIDNAEFGYIFKMEVALCRLLRVKADLGVRTRALYEKGDREGLLSLSENDYAKAIRLTREFRGELWKYWSRDKKVFGFEVQDLRLGGILMRLEVCAGTLKDYVTGNIDSIPQLDEAPVYLYDSDCSNASRYFKFENIVTTNKLRH